MYFKQKDRVMFRDYGEFGYIVDNKIFGYKAKVGDDRDVGDKVLSKSASVFFSVLSKEPQSFEIIVRKICSIFSDVDIDVIKEDAAEFYEVLEKDGFIVSGKTFEDCKNSDVKFSYNICISENINDGYSSNAVYPEITSREFIERYLDGVPNLTSLHVEITSRCNERCVHCYIPHEYKVRDIDDDVFFDILDQCRDMRVLHITLSGGEPMLHGSFLDFLKKTREIGLSVNILSNLTLLDDEIISEMAKNPLLSIQVSLYSMDPDIHDSVTCVKGSYSKTKDSILKIVANNIPLQISCPVLVNNVECYKDVVRWAEGMNVYVVTDNVIIAQYNNDVKNLNYRLNNRDVDKIIKDKSGSGDKYFQRMREEVAKKKTSLPTDYICSVCNSSLCISENGSVYPCAGWQGCVVGNVNESSISDIWRSSDKVIYLRGLRRSDFPRCLECEYKDFCTMCMVRNANESPTGDLFEINEYFCNIARLNKKVYTDWQDGQEGA
ncbi:radical SAM/SPASM domain-containing protein [Desulfovibrio subterraneus]|uniref:Radical SAM core domain-containing protein n=1 Tax=Desulfovibrio subterraneus TaxID=2718620 RepID=A0A7J0BFG6_9BACT|nr:radical SAM protein [Desulfovibrio subterraneus]GFM32429.1 hypothetical protein DSM101010T_07940 [Desulfovibrio subterraneus]